MFETQAQIDETNANLKDCESKILQTETRLEETEARLEEMDALDDQTVSYLRGKEQQLRKYKTQLQGRQQQQEQQLRELWRWRREGDPGKKRETREKAAAATKTFTRVYKRADTGLLEKIGCTQTKAGWDNLVVMTSPGGFEEIDLGALSSGKGPEKGSLKKEVREFKDVKDGATYAPVEPDVPALFVTLDRSVDELLKESSNRVRADEDALVRHLVHELSRCFVNLTKVDIARTLYCWKRPGSAAEFADLVRRARLPGANETALAVELTKLKVDNVIRAIHEFDAVLVGDDVVALGFFKSIMRVDELYSVTTTINAIQVGVANSNEDYAIFRGKKILPVLYGGYLGFPEYKARLFEEAKRFKLLLYTRNGHEMGDVPAAERPRDYEPPVGDEARSVVPSCDYFGPFLRSPL